MLTMTLHSGSELTGLLGHEPEGSPNSDGFWAKAMPYSFIGQKRSIIHKRSRYYNDYTIGSLAYIPIAYSANIWTRA